MLWRVPTSLPCRTSKVRSSLLPRLDRFENVERFIEGDRAMFTYDFVCIDPIGLCRTAERVRIIDGLVHDIELFFDARPFEAMQRALAAGQRS